MALSTILCTEDNLKLKEENISFISQAVSLANDSTNYYIVWDAKNPNSTSSSECKKEKKNKQREILLKQVKKPLLLYIQTTYLQL